MTTRLAEKELPEEKERTKTNEITFKCKICGMVKPLSQLREVRRFYPILLACSDCEEKMCGSGRKIKWL